MIAALPMYDRPETRAAQDAFWQLIRFNLGAEAPDKLTRKRDVWDTWTSPDLLLAQTCGMPFRTRLKDRVTLVGTPDFAVENCPPGYYCSTVITRHDEDRPLDGLRLAVNEGLSQSGWAAAHAYLDARGMTPASIVLTGAHAASARAVARGDADIAFIDAVTWRQLARWDDVAAALTVIDHTPPTPGLPYITALGHDPAPLRSAIRAAIDSLPPQARELLGLRGLVEIPASAYFAIPNPPPPPAEAAHLP